MLLIAFVLLIVFLIHDGDKYVAENKGKDRTQDSLLSVKKLDTLVNAIKNDGSYEVKEVYYNPMTQALSIALTNKDNVITEHVVNNYYFDKNYGIDSFAQIEGTYIFEYKPGKLLEHAGDYKTPVSYNSRNVGRKIAAFKTKFFEPTGSFYIIETYLKDHITDLDRFEYEGSFEPDLNEDGTYSVKARFKSKNQFGVLVEHSIYCKITENGDIISAQYDL